MYVCEVSFLVWLRTWMLRLIFLSRNCQLIFFADDVFTFFPSIRGRPRNFFMIVTVRSTGRRPKIKKEETIGGGDEKDAEKEWRIVLFKNVRFVTSVSKRFRVGRKVIKVINKNLSFVTATKKGHSEICLFWTMRVSNLALTFCIFYGDYYARRKSLYATKTVVADRGCAHQGRQFLYSWPFQFCNVVL